ncbi:hypothetical protein QJS10_CPA03g01050 [Acorus calamus]|uniref:Uncharacterized protein n=1 Tax=Acorus calamus TaxID=4465 RepID=A0AAV9FAM8_ACOCL|nr:hypothetical protein QJS10_CPA03g01050 [Acorus calamus]
MERQYHGCVACSGGTHRCGGGKTEWPELVGAKATVAREIIERENPNVKVHPIRCHTPRIMNCCCNRVWLDYDDVHGTVCAVPRVG